MKTCLVGFVLILVFAACSPDVPIVEVPSAEPTFETAVATLTDTPTITPTPAAQPTVLLVTGSGVDPFVTAQIQTLLASLVDDSATKLVTLDGLTPEALTPEVQVVVGVGQNLEMNTLALSAPRTSFVVIGDPTAVVGDNVSIVGNPEDEARQLAFLAGYLSALISSDNKVVGLIPVENAARDLLAESFVVGARFFCGLCHPVYPPYNPFPQWELLPSAVNEEYRLVVDNFNNMGVEVVYVHGELISPELLAYLEELGMRVVSDRSPEALSSNWVGTVVADPLPALEAIWPDLLLNSPGQYVPSVLMLTDQEMGLVSEGRYRLFEVMVAELQAGLASVEITP